MSTHSANPFRNPALVTSYEEWYSTMGRRADRLEKALLEELLAHFPGVRSLLEVGCGTGHFTRWFAEQGLSVAGLDASAAMLMEAKRLGLSPSILGNAESLPFPDRSFDLVVAITMLEFVPDPARALSEAMRVARRGLLLGALNRHSVMGLQLKRSGLPLWENAHFFTPEELASLAQHAAGSRGVRILWRTTLWPVWPRELQLPWGGFIGMAVKLQGPERQQDRK